MLAAVPTWIVIGGPMIVVLGAAIPYGLFFWLFRKDDPWGEEHRDG